MFKNIMLIVIITLSFSTQLHASDKLAEVNSEWLQKQFFNAARTGNVKILKFFAAADVDLNVQDRKGYSALILSAYHGHQGAVDFLLAEGASACVEDKRGNTALMGAIFKAELKIAHTLMQQDCDPNQANKACQTAAMFAALFGKQHLLTQLREQGASLTQRDQQGNSVKSLAQQQGNVELLEHLGSEQHKP